MVGVAAEGLLLPAVVGGRHTVGGSVDREEGVAGIVVAMKLVQLLVGGQDLIQLVHLGGTGVGVVVAE